MWADVDPWSHEARARAMQRDLERAQRIHGQRDGYDEPDSASGAPLDAIAAVLAPLLKLVVTAALLLGVGAFLLAVTFPGVTP